MSEEQYLREQLAMLHRQYLKDAEPIIKRLAAIESMKFPEPVFVLREINGKIIYGWGGFGPFAKEKK